MKIRQGGFTLLEAMVAIIILSTTMFAIYSWVNVSIQTLVRAESVLEQELLIEELLEELRMTNLDKLREGSVASGHLSLHWSAIPNESRSSFNDQGARGLYDHTLYDISIDVVRSNEFVAGHVTRIVTSERVRDPIFEL